MNNETTNQVVKTVSKSTERINDIKRQATFLELPNANQVALEFISNLVRVPKYDEIPMEQIKGAFLTVARKNLSADKRHYYLISYNGKFEVQLGYMGHAEMAHRNGVDIGDPIPVYQASLDKGFINLDNGVFTHKIMQCELDKLKNPNEYPQPDISQTNFGDKLVGFVISFTIKGVKSYEFISTYEIYWIFKTYSNASDAWKKSTMSMLKTKAVKLAIRKHQIEIANATGNDLQGEIQKIEGSHVQVGNTDKTQQVTMLSENEQSVIIDTEYQDVQEKASLDDAESNFLSDDDTKKLANLANLGEKIQNSNANAGDDSHSSIDDILG